MLAKFVDGPYDGRWIDNETINRCCTLHPINAVPPRLFLLMPPIEYWEEIVSGQRLKNESNGGKLWPYERIHVGSDVQFHDAASNGRFEAALRGEHPDPYDVFGSHEQLLVTATYR